MDETRGRISTEYTVWCGTCSRRDAVAAPPTAHAKRAGWRWAKLWGWRCPDCQRKDHARAGRWE
jgi:hypothetical protein